MEHWWIRQVASTVAPGQATLPCPSAWVLFAVVGPSPPRIWTFLSGLPGFQPPAGADRVVAARDRIGSR